MATMRPLKPLFWVGSSQEDLQAFPREVRREIGFARYLAQTGGKHPDVKPLRGFGGAGVLEIVTAHFGAAYRVVYTVTLAGAVYVLHAFLQKSKRGIATPKPDIEVIRARLKRAQDHYLVWREHQKGQTP